MAETKKMTIEAITTTDRFVTDPVDATLEELAGTRAILASIGDLSYLRLEVAGNDVYLNPKYIVALTLIEEDN